MQGCLNEFMFTAVVDDDGAGGGVDFEHNTLLVVLDGHHVEVILDEHSSMPPDKDLEAGDAVMLAGRFVVLDGEIVPVVMDVTLEDDEDDDDE